MSCTLQQTTQSGDTGQQIPFFTAVNQSIVNLRWTWLWLTKVRYLCLEYTHLTIQCVAQLGCDNVLMDQVLLVLFLFLYLCFFPFQLVFWPNTTSVMVARLSSQLQLRIKFCKLTAYNRRLGLLRNVCCKGRWRLLNLWKAQSKWWWK